MLIFTHLGKNIYDVQNVVSVCVGENEGKTQTHRHSTWCNKNDTVIVQDRQLLVKYQTWLAELTPQMAPLGDRLTCFSEPSTCVQAVPACWDDDKPVLYQIWLLLLTPMTAFVPTSSCLRLPSTFFQPVPRSPGFVKVPWWRQDITTDNNTMANASWYKLVSRK